MSFNQTDVSAASARISLLDAKERARGNHETTTA
jgi:hypothetical protein